MNTQKLLLTICLSAISAALYGQSPATEKVVTFRFVPGEDMFYTPWKGNGGQIGALYRLVDEYRNEIASGEIPVYVNGYSASMRDAARNRELAFIRANRVKSELITHKGLLEEHFITKNHTTAYTDTDGVVYKDMVVVTLRIPAKPVPKSEPELRPEQTVEQQPSQEVEEKSEPEQVIAIGKPDEESLMEIPAARQTVRKPLFAIKTNLLFDLAAALNLEIEVPIGERWSVAGECIFPWWLWKSERYAAQALAGTLEARYRFGRREGRPQMTGWFAGIYGGGGYYDIEWRDDGCQGEVFHAGLSAGYAHSISKNNNWRMEYSIGVGYLNSCYREYASIWGLDGEWHLVRRRNGDFEWFGPTRAKVSLVWMINGKNRMKGGAQ